MKAGGLHLQLIGAMFLLLFVSHSSSGQAPTESAALESTTAEWIWSPAHTKNKVPVGDCYFRKSFQLQTPEFGEVQITADNRFELFVNGESVGQGDDWRKLQVFDISEHLNAGKNSVSIRVSNTDEGSAGLAGRVLIKEKSGTYVDHPTNASWKTSVRNYENWQSTQFPDQEWIGAASYGPLGATLPWGDEVVIDGIGTRFNIAAEFAIERLMRDEEVGSLIAMTFDSQGNILASREGGPLLLITDHDDNGTHDSVAVYCEQIKNVQGILSLGTRVFAVGDGPEGVALYRLRDADRDGMAEEIESLVPIRGSRGEHGAHAVRLGPDGLLYVIVGDHARVGAKPEQSSPYGNAYEGDLVQPRHEDPRGHAVGIPAPGGTIFRTDANGSFVELVAGGMRNAYDFAFSETGELFTYDSDMEWDTGAPWYRPTRFNHVTAGAEMGWRSGWAKWPEYYLDSLPAALDIGPGSPTGVELYNHNAFPAQYRNTLFACDWATGRIHAVRFERSGASYRAESEVFLAGRPLNATDITVGPNGALYFCTGGRGTDGGIYRIRWTGEKSEGEDKDNSGIELAVQQPQLHSDWARAKVAGVKARLADEWDQQLQDVVLDSSRKVRERVRALDLMVTFGPWPSDELLVEVSHAEDAVLRGKATSLMFASRSSSCQERVIELLNDSDPLVRRVACETIMRRGDTPPMEDVVKLLADDDRFVAFAAQRVLEHQDIADWGKLAINHDQLAGFCQGAVAMLSSRRQASVAKVVLERCVSTLRRHADEQAPLNEKQLTDLMRVVQLAFIHGKLEHNVAPSLGKILLDCYPSGHESADRELVRLLVYLQVPGAADKFAEQLASKLSQSNKLHIAAYASQLDTGWNVDAKLTHMKFFEEARAADGGYSVSAYLENFARDFFARLSLDERHQVLAVGEQWPTSALSVLAKLPKDPGREILSELRALDSRVKPLCEESDDFRRLRVGIFAVLGRSGDAESMAYLREVYREQPEHRHTVAMSLTVNPGGENWPLLIDSLKTATGRVAQEVLAALSKVEQSPREPEPYRQVILQGLKLKENGGQLALRLLDHWAGQSPEEKYPDWQQQLSQWQSWYSQNFPAAPPAELPVDSGTDKWSYAELLKYLESPTARQADAAAGKQAFELAQCAKCHRCNGFGETIGPDLTNVAQRFQKREILHSIVYPSHDISDQYASRIVLSNGRTYAGLVVPRGEAGITVLLSDGEKVELAHSDIDEIKAHAVSVMPSGLLNSLSLSQVADLFAYLESASRQEMAQQKSSVTR